MLVYKYIADAPKHVTLHKYTHTTHVRHCSVGTRIHLELAGDDSEEQRPNGLKELLRLSVIRAPTYNVYMYTYTDVHTFVNVLC